MVELSSISGIKILERADLKKKNQHCLQFNIDKEVVYAVFNSIQNLNDWHQYLQRSTKLSHQIQQMANYLQENDKLINATLKQKLNEILQYIQSIE